jgi:hypothetical protein
MNLAEMLEPYVATTRPVSNPHVCPAWASRCREDGVIHVRPASVQVTRQPHRVADDPDILTVELYSGSDDDGGRPRIYINQHDYTFEQARTLALALLELVSIAGAGSVPTAALHRPAHTTTEGTIR